MKKKCIYLFSFIFILLVSAGSIKAQVTIGADIEPEEYAILQLEGTNGGLRLPKLNNTQKATLQTKITGGKVKSEGLAIFNKDEDAFEIWNGTKWIKLSESAVVTLVAENGITIGSGNRIRLGGSLDATTNINLNNQILKFDATATSSKLQFIDGKESSGMLLGSLDNQGTLGWVPLAPLASVVQGSLRNGISIQADYPPLDITSQSLTLPAGKWLIMAKYSSKMTYTTQNVMYSWIYLQKKGASEASFSTVNCVGAQPEIKSAGYAYATPQVSYLATISETTVFRVYANNSSNPSPLKPQTTDEFGGSHFYAIRLDFHQ